MKRFDFLLLPVLLAASTVQAQTPPVTFKPTRVAIFKNGTCFIKKEAAVNLVNGHFTFVPPGNALYGTYWLSAGGGLGIKSVSVRSDSFAVQKNVVEMADAITANIGRSITIRRSAYNSNTGVREHTGTVLGYDRASETIRMQTAENRLLIAKLDDLEEVVADAAQTRFYKTDSVGALARVTLDKEVNQAAITTLGLYNGIIWHPSYLFRVLNDKEARLDMKATIENTGEALRQMPVDLVVGNPSMFFGKRLDPLCMELMELYLDRSAVSNNSYQIANAVSYHTQAVRVNLSNDEDDEGGGGRSAAGEKTQDLYYFKLGQLNLEAASKTVVPVFSHTVQYKDVYEVIMPHIEVSDYTRSAVVQESKPLEVVHSFVFGNTTKTPITSGAVLALDAKENPLAQEELKYTPEGTQGVIKLSKAIDVQAKNEEEVTEIQEKFKKIDKDYYDRITMKGQVKLSNFQDKKILLSVTKYVEGEVSSVSNGGRATRLRMNRSGDNPVSVIKWEIELNPGQSTTITYEFRVFD